MELRSESAASTPREHCYRTERTDRVVLIAEDEARLTAWMQSHLRLSWCEHPDPVEVERAVIARWAPPLNIDHATGAIRDIVTAARAAYNSSA
ncbi:GIY-YIG nuclease family protein [Dietzia cinnamea]|uniref:GIY-YIG nuclease family protein n=1 Tax=Dietzia cinnamea TaxID=321318 RepID=UPI002E2F14E0|nr:hypothetical protein [Dietzia cinnamea]